MEGLRWATGEGRAGAPPCSRCQATGCPWDRIAGTPICPDCQERLALGEGEALVERLRPAPCAVCRQAGSVVFLTFPLKMPRAVEIDLCPRHFRGLVNRCLDRFAFRRLGWQLHRLGVQAQQVFLLHEAFYDDSGRPLQPVHEP